jgi:endonuclease III
VNHRVRFSAAIIARRRNPFGQFFGDTLPSMARVKTKLPRRWTLAETVDVLEKTYGRPPRPAITDPFEIVLLENAAYLVDEARRMRVFQSLRERVGLSPEAILAAPDSVLVEAIREGGMRPADRAAKLRRCAELSREIGLDHLRRAVRTDPAGARKLLKRFPGIGEPGAEKILLWNKSLVTLAPGSGGLRVLVRLGFGREEKDYSRTYRSAAEGVAPELPSDFAWLFRARELVKRHGEELCRRSPRCEACPLAARCVAFQTHSFRSF